MTRHIAYLFAGALVALTLSACGGAQPADLPAEPAAPPTPIAAPEPEPVVQEPEHVYYQAYWRDIHVLTIYRGAGTLRSEDPTDRVAAFDGRSDYMTAISHYVEREEELAEYAARATSLDEFLQILRDEGYEIVEDYLEEGY